MPEVKVSFHTQTAKGSAGHNDRSTYGRSPDYGGDETTNKHWDCYRCGSSVDAERRFYEENFADVLFEQNERYVSSRHPEKVKDMDAYMRAHPVRESVIQLGDKDTQVEPGYLESVAASLDKRFRAAGCRLVSADIHYDKWEDEDGVHEATPHMHLRWMGIDSKGKPNLAGALAEHGVQRPKPDKPRSRHNTELMTFTADIREFLESEAERYLAKVAPDVTLNTERDPDAKHLEPEAYRLKMRREEKELETERRALQQDVDEDLALSRARLQDEREEYMSEAAEQTVTDMAVLAVEVAYSDIKASAEVEARRIEAKARERADEIEDEAQSSARKMRRQARMDADKTIDVAERDADSIRDEADRYEKQRRADADRYAKEQARSWSRTMEQAVMYRNMMTDAAERMWETEREAASTGSLAKVIGRVANALERHVPKFSKVCAWMREHIETICDWVAEDIDRDFEKAVRESEPRSHGIEDADTNAKAKTYDYVRQSMASMRRDDDGYEIS